LHKSFRTVAVNWPVHRLVIDSNRKITWKIRVLYSRRS